jgi:hypothetical protein
VAEQAQEVTQFEVAIPFIVAIGLLFAGAFLGELIRRRVEELYSRMLSEAKTPQKNVPYALQPPSIAWMALWVIDAAQSLAIVVVPAIGALLLYEDLGTSATIAYLAVFIAAGVSVYFFLTADHPDSYLKRFVWIFSPLALIGMALNFVAGLVAVLTTD